MKIFVTGVNGFIGSHFLEMALKETDWEIQGFDLSDNNITEFLSNPRFNMKTGDIFKEEAWLNEKIKECDVLLPLIGIARPAYYIEKPFWTFELDFEQNLKMVKKCAEYGKRVIFPSTSEVYGMASANHQMMEEDTTNLVLGPVPKTRWIYSCSKQMMDRVIFALGQERGLKFTLFRPFNWLGPRLDSFAEAKKRKGRSITQFIYDVLYTGQITLVNGGMQRRSFTWVGDGIRGLIDIIENKDNKADGQIFNIGNPDNNYSIKEMAETVVDEMKKFPCFKAQAEKVKFVIEDADKYYGKNYDDMQDRLPSIKKMETLLGWKPQATLRDAIRYTLQWYAEKLK